MSLQEDARRLGVESSVGDLRRDVVPRHVGPVACLNCGGRYRIRTCVGVSGRRTVNAASWSA